MLIDTHCHLNFKAFNKDLDEVITRAKNAGVAKIIIPGAKVDSSQRAVEIANGFPQCFAAVGIHPHHANSVNEIQNEIAILAKQKKVVAIGEIGLDHYQYKGYPPISDEEKSRQKELFLVQLELALKFNLPVIIHCRQAHDDLLNILTELKKIPPGVFHCFDGEKKHLKKVLNLGFFVGFDGNITYPENKHLRELVKITPLDRLLIETDSPFLTPVPFRGTRNEPLYISYIAEAIASQTFKKTSEIAGMTSFNASGLFHL